MDGDRDATGEDQPIQSEPVPETPAAASEPTAAEPIHPMWQASPETIAWQPPAPWETLGGASTPPPAAYPPPPDPAAMPPEGSYQPYPPQPAPQYQPRTWSIGPTWSVTPAFVSARRLATIVTTLLAVAGVLALAESIHFIIGVNVQGQINTAHATQADADSFNSLMTTLSLARVAIALVCGVAFMRWLWRSLNNAWHLDAGEGISSPKMSVVAWFIPFYNFVRPYHIVIDLHDRLLSPLQSKSGRRLIKAWWAMWLIGTFVGELVLMNLRSSGSAATGLDRLTSMAILAVLAALSVADAILAIAVVRQVQRLSDARELAKRGYPTTAIELVAQSQRPRITRVPVLLAVAAIAILVVPLGAVYSSSSAAPSWVQFQPTDQKFTVSLPGSPLEKPIKPYDSNGLTISGDVFQAGEKGTLAFIITYYDYPSGTFAGTNPSILLTRLQTSMATQSTIESTADRTINGRSAREFVTTYKGANVKAIACVDGDRVYVVEADFMSAESSSPDIDRFLDSFTLP
jgi:hypothetical protein